jgi:hypothetical protein
MSKLCRYLIAFVAPVMAQQVSPTINNFPSREFGQPQLLTSLVTVAPNLVEGRELYSPFAVAFDTTASPPIMYVADRNNNRVLAWKNPSGLGVCGLSDPSCGFADPLVIGQRDRFSTIPGGPGRTGGISTGFSGPSAVAVDSSGNVYVVDSGNNRILRFPAPFKQTGALLQTDLVIGQKTVNSGGASNEGNQTPSASTISLSAIPSGTTAIAFDSSGALWVPDPGNNRALRFPASQLAAGTIEPVADIVLGQLDFVTGTERPAPQGQPLGSAFFKGNLRQPAGAAIAASGAIYISDGYARVLYYLPGIPSGSAGISASRILGLGINISSQLTPVNNYGLSTTVPGLMISGNNLYVADAGGNRIVKYDTPDNWPAEANIQLPNITTQFSPPMIDVIGQTSLSNGKINKGQPEPDATTLNTPLGGAFQGSDLWVADYGNNRVISFPLQGGRYSIATRLVGQLDWPYFSPNLIEGREVNFQFGNPLAGVIVDNTSVPPHLYVADTFNNRILGFKDARNIPLGSKADLVIGQRDFYRSLINGNTNDPQLPNQLGLYQPSGLAVDSKGNLYVADTGNGRVLRFPTPFTQPTTTQQTPNLVLGQSNFNSLFTDPSISSMRGPVGLTLFSDGSLAVSDFVHSRVLIFKKQGGDFQNGQSASAVLGQPDPNSSGASTSTAGMNSPRQIAVDSSDRLYIADFGNSRLLVWPDGKNQSTGAGSAAQFNGIAAAQGIAVSPTTGEIWISNSSNNQVLELPEFNKLILGSTPTSYPVNNGVQAQTAAAAVALDASGNLIVAESANRIAFFFAAAAYQNAASYNSKPMAPGMLALVYRQGKPFSFTDFLVSQFPWPPMANDVQVTVNGTPGPIYSISNAAGFIAFQIPSNAPTSGNAEFLVTHPSTGEIIASGEFPMAISSPAFFTAGAAGLGQAAALNFKLDGTFLGVNSPSNPVPRDGSSFIAFCLTGAGVFSGGPDAPPVDGFPPTGNSGTRVRPSLIAGPFGGVAPDADILGSTAGCGFPGGWQINFKVENVFPVSSNNVIVVQLDGNPSNVGPNSNIQITFATK